MVYFMHITEFDTDVYIVGKTEEECIQNAIKALERMAVRYGGYESYAEYIEVAFDMDPEKFEFEKWIDNYYGAFPKKIDDFYIWGE